MPILTKDMEAPPAPPPGPSPWPLWLFVGALLTLPLLYYYIPSEAQRRHEENRSFREATTFAHDLRVDDPRDPRWDEAERLLRRHIERYPETPPPSDPNDPRASEAERLIRRHAEAAYLLGTAELVIARRQSPPTRNALQSARGYLMDAARRGYAPSAVASSVHRLLEALDEHGDLDLTWAAAEAFVDPKVESLAPFRSDLRLVRDRARLAARLAARLYAAEDAPTLAAAEAMGKEAGRLAAEAPHLSSQTEDQVASLRLEADVAFTIGEAAALRASRLAAEEDKAARRRGEALAAESRRLSEETRDALDRLLKLHAGSRVGMLTGSQQAEVYLLLGKAAARLNDPVAALQDFDRSVELGSGPVRHQALYRAALENQSLRSAGDERLPPSVKPEANGACPPTHPVRWRGRCLTRTAASEALFREMITSGSALASFAHLELAWNALGRGRAVEALDDLDAASRDPALASSALEAGVTPTDIYNRVKGLREIFTEDEPLERMTRILGQFADRFEPETSFRTEEATAYEALAARAEAEAAHPDAPRGAIERSRARARGFRRLAGDRWARLAHQDPLPLPAQQRLEQTWAAARNFLAARAYEPAYLMFDEFTSRAAEDPRRSEAFYRAGIALQRLGRYEEAVRRHQHNLDAYPDSPAWTPFSRLEQGLCWLSMGRTPEERRSALDQGMDRCREILRDDMRLTPESEVWQRALFHLGKAEAERRHAEVLAAGAGKADATSALASAARRHLTEFLRRYASEAFAPAPARRPPANPYAVPAAVLLGGLEQGERRYAEARAAYRLAVMLGEHAAPPDEDEIVVLAAWPDHLRKAFFAGGDCSLAEAMALLLARSRAESRRRAAETDYDGGRHPEAEQAYRDALEQVRAAERAYATEGVARLRDAERAFTEALERYDLTPDRLIGYLGRCRARQTLADQAADLKNVSQAAALAAEAQRDIEEAERTLVQFQDTFEQAGTGFKEIQPLRVWKSEAASVRALLAEVQRKLGLVQGGGK